MCVRAWVRASATLHAARKRVAGWSRFFSSTSAQQQLDSVTKANGRSWKRIYTRRRRRSLSPMSYAYLLRFAYVGLIEKLHGTVSGLSIERTWRAYSAFLVHLYHVDVRHLTFFFSYTRSADLLDLSCSRRRRDILLWNGIH